MKQFGIIVGLIILLLIGGGLTTQLISGGQQPLMPVLRQTDNPEASVIDVVPWQAEQFVLIIGFILFNLIGMGVTIAVVVWLLDRGLRHARAAAGAAGPPARQSARSEAAE